MDITVYNENFQAVYILEAYESLLWTDRYFKEGEFEIYTPVTDDVTTFIKPNCYLSIPESEHMMIVEDITIETNIEEGNHIKIVGRSLESILDRRIVWGEVTISGNLQNEVKKLISNNITSPSDSARKIDNFIYEDTEDSGITSLTVEEQYEGKDLLEIISSICEDKEIGFKIVLNDNNQFVFSLYKGIDRSYEQDVLPWVVFRPDFENTLNTNYAEINSEYKTITLVKGTETIKTEDDEGRSSSEEVDVTRVIGTGSGLSRREIYTQATDVRREDDMSHSEFIALLDKKGNDALKEHNVKRTFDGEYETTRMFKYKRDFFMGDTLQVANEYGMEAPCRITEFIYSQDSGGKKSYPTFTALDYPD